MSDTSPRRGLLIGLGIAFILAGLISAIVLWSAGGTRKSNAIKGFARAPVGCDTTLDFVETGTYTVFVENAGTIDSVRGDCDLDGDYAVESSGPPDVDVSIIDPDGEEIDVRRSTDGVEYADGGFVGESVLTFEIAQPNDHVIRVTSTDDEAFAVAIGRDPDDGVGALRAGALAAGVLASLVGLVMILLGARRKRPVPAPGGPWTAAPTGAPSPYYGQQGPAPQGPPVYGQPGPAGPPGFPAQPAQYPQQQPAQYPPQQTPAPYPQQQPAQYPPQAPASYPQQVPAHDPQQHVVPPQPSWSPTPPPPAPPTAAPPQAPVDPAGSAQPIDWSPSGASADEHDTQQSPPPPPPN